MFPANAVSLVNLGVTIEFDMVSCGTKAIKYTCLLSAEASFFDIPAARSRTATLLRLHLSCNLLPQKETSNEPKIDG